MALMRCALVAVLIVAGLTSNIIVLDAIPVTRTQGLMNHENPGNFQPSMNNIQLGVNDEKTIIQGRILMEVELQDYPGSGANNRHTPHPQFVRGCADC